MSVDPLAEKYPGWSAYNYTMNNPVKLVDPNGMEAEDIIIIGSKEYQKKVSTAIHNLSTKSEAGYDLVMNAIGSDRDFVIADTKSDIANFVNNFSDQYSILTFDIGQAITNLDAANGTNGKQLSQTIETSLAHELAHCENGLGLQPGSVLIDKNGYSTGIPADEPYAVMMENRVRKDFGLNKRTHYSGLNVVDKKAVQSRSNKLGFNLVSGKDKYSNSIDTRYATQSIYNSVKNSYEDRRNYSIGGSGIDRYLKPGANNFQLRFSNIKK